MNELGLKSFIQHYNLVRWIRGDRNSFNASDRTIWYRGTSVLLWFLLIPVKVLDLVGLFYLFDVVRRSVILTRKLSEYELLEAKKVYGDSINWEQVRIRENSWMARVGARSAKRKHLGFVLFRTINFSRELDHEKYSTDLPWLVHELAHVLQFRYLGAQYILEALRAQRNAGYGYKGITGLKEATHLEDFNLEQQADVARHYYQKLIKKEDVTIYDSFIEEMRNGKV